MGETRMNGVLLHVLFILVTALVTCAVASDFTAGDMIITDPWARATPPVARVGAGYVALNNTGGDDERLLSASAEVAESVELHTHIMEDNVMRMREVASIEIPAGGRVLLEPGGLHIMFIGLKAPLVAGETFPLTLTFEKAGETTVTVTVRRTGTR